MPVPRLWTLWLSSRLITSTSLSPSAPERCGEAGLVRWSMRLPGNRKASGCQADVGEGHRILAE